MSAIDKISKNDLRELLTKGWITHDAMWVFHCVEELGIEKTNKINTAAVESMSRIEIHRIKKALGFTKEKIDSFDELTELMKGAMELVKADFMKFEWSIPRNNVLQWGWKQNECFAYEGIKNLGVIDEYKCGVMLRIKGWLKELGVSFSVDPEIDGCLMKTGGECSGRLSFNFQQ